MENLATVVAIITGLCAIGVYGWYLWTHCGLREWVGQLIANYRAYQTETDILNRMWGPDA